MTGQAADTLYVDVQARTDEKTFRQMEADAEAAAGRAGKKGGGALTSALGGAIQGLPALAAGAAVAVGAALAGGAVGITKLAEEAAQNVRNFQAELGVTKTEAEALGGVAEEVFKNNWGESLTEAGEMVKNVRAQVKGLTDEELAKVTGASAAIADTFQEDQAKVAQAIQSVMTATGASAAEATDFITAGFQKGLNSSEDFLDTLNEYGPQFEKAGIGAGELFSLLETGSAAGVLGTDKIADAFKEFSLRAADGAKATGEAYAQIGLSQKQVEADLRSGATTYAQLFGDVTERLKGVKNEADRTNIIAALFGGAGEDLGKGLAGLDLTKTKLGDLGGAADSLSTKYDSFGAFFAGVWREVQVSLLPVGKEILALANEAMPSIKAAIGQVMPVVSQLATTLVTGMREGHAVLRGFGPVLGEVQGTFRSILSTLAPIVKVAFDAIVPIVKALGPLFQAAFGVIKTVWDTVLRPTLSALEPVFRVVFGLISGEVKGSIEIITGVLKAVSALMRGDVSGAVKAVQEMFMRAGETMGRAMLSAGETIVKALGGLPARMTDLARQIVAGLASGIRNGVGQIGEAARGLASTVIDRVKSTLGIRSPSVRMQELGTNTAQGFVRGIEAQAPEVRGAAQRTVDGFMGVLAGLSKAALPPLLTNLLEGMKGGTLTVDMRGGAAATTPVQHYTLNVGGITINAPSDRAGDIRRAVNEALGDKLAQVKQRKGWGDGKC